MNTPDETECTVDAKDIHSIVPDGGLTAWLTVLGAQVSVVHITPRPN
jgi:hypothetical protein